MDEEISGESKVNDGDPFVVGESRVNSRWKQMLQEKKHNQGLAGIGYMRLAGQRFSQYYYTILSVKWSGRGQTESRRIGGEWPPLESICLRLASGEPFVVQTPGSTVQTRGAKGGRGRARFAARAAIEEDSSVDNSGRSHRP